MPLTLVLGAYYFATFSSVGLFVPFIPAWLRSSGIGGVGLLLTIWPLAGVFAPPFFGWLSDRFNMRGRLIRWACAGVTLSYGSMAVAAALGMNSFWVLFVVLLLSALFRAPMMMLADVIAVETNVRYGRLRLWGSLGFLVAAMFLGPLLELDIAYQLPMAMALLSALAWFISYRLPTDVEMPSAPEAGYFVQFLKRPGVLVFAFATLAGQIAHAAYDQNIGLLILDLGGNSHDIGLNWAIAVGGEVLLMIFADSWMKRFQPAWLIIISLLIAAGRWFALSRASSVWDVLLLQPLHCAVFALRWVASIEFVKRASSSANSASAQGVFAAMVGLGGLLGMNLWEPIYSRFGGEVVFVGAAGVAALGALAMALGTRRAQLS